MGNTGSVKSSQLNLQSYNKQFPLNFCSISVQFPFNFPSHFCSIEIEWKEIEKKKVDELTYYRFWLLNEFCILYPFVTILDWTTRSVQSCFIIDRHGLNSQYPLKRILEIQSNAMIYVSIIGYKKYILLGECIISCPQGGSLLLWICFRYRNFIINLNNQIIAR